ncbi:MAG TPA: T9SS type A sorting domain-containing protein, partial [Panacibacter sp.]|nr:T9SS type A sorting domain-containing protein [Panacibacter sp.]
KHLFTVFFCTAFSFIVNAQPGTLDNSFDEDGEAYLRGEYIGCNAMALQNDGKIIQAGIGTLDGVNGFYLARFNTDGSLDKTFGNAGRVVTGLPGIQEEILSLALQSDGKIVAAGYVDGVDIALVRYFPDGRVDSSFGTNGVVITDIRRYDYLKAMAVQADDKIVVTGITETEEYNTENPFIIRYNSDGSYDESFGDQGTVLIPQDNTVDPYSIALQPDGKILIGGGLLYYTSPMVSLPLMRCMPNGSLDTEFGSNGIATVPGWSGYSAPFFYSIKVDADGKIVVAGSAVIPGGKSAMLTTRFTRNGKIDDSFGKAGGIVLQPMGPGESEARKVLIQPDSKIITIGYYYEFSGPILFALARYKSDGTIDSSFGESGLVFTDMGDGATTNCAGGELQPDGKIIVAGATYKYDITNPVFKFALARYNGGDAILPISYNKFTATQNKASITLNWQTATEVNNSYFAVERSSNAVNYTSVAQVSSVETNAAINDYAYTDKLPLAGNNYYRLKQVDKDGKYSYSKTISINYIKPGSVQLYPNPAKDKLTVKGLNGANTSSIAVLNIQGKQLLQFSAKAATYSFSIGSLAPGTYMVRVKDDNGIATEKFVKQ